MASQGSTMKLTVLGCRGSVATSGAQYAQFGGNTSCYMVEAGGQTILLDAGSGIAKAPACPSSSCTILLSHLHMDHLQGLGMYRRLMTPHVPTSLYVPAHGAQEARMLIRRIYSPPYWPLELTALMGSLRIEAMPPAMCIGNVEVQTAAGNHPGGCLLIKLSFAQKTLVYATDFEHNKEASARLADFAHEADLILYDGQYDDKEYESHRGFGHSTPSFGVDILERSCAKRLLIVHHDPACDDETLLARERALGRADVRFAREGEVIEL